MTRLEIATTILGNICAGDWRFDIPEGITWDDIAVKRALELTDKLMDAEVNGAIVIEPKEVAEVAPIPPTLTLVDMESRN
jgi:hypothetical protein